MDMLTKKFLYLFIDEGGNFDFSSKGTRHFTLSCLSKERPFYVCQELLQLKYDLIESGLDIEYFHASEDRQVVRDLVVKIILRNLNGVRVDSVIVEKRKTNPAIRDVQLFYPKMMAQLLKYVFKGYDLSQYSEVIIFTDQIPLKKNREAVKKAIKIYLSQQLPSGVRYRIYHHDSKSNFDLQIADYFNWAIYRKWESGDVRSYQKLAGAIRSEFNIFQKGNTTYY